MQQDKWKQLNSLLAALIGTVLLVFVGLRIVYPKNYFDSTKNNMTVVATKFTDSEKLRGYLTVAPQIEHNFYSATLELDLRSKEVLQAVQEVEVMKGFMAQLYPLGKELVTAEDLKSYIFSDDAKIPNGQLVSTKDAVYIYSRGKWRPFLGAQIFENLQFDWERVEALKPEFKDSFEEGERIIFRTPHPDGTIFKTKSNKFFLVWDEKLLPIKNEEIIKEVWGNYFVVKIDKVAPQKVGKCSQALWGERLKCSFVKEQRTRKMLGNVFIFDLGKEIEAVTGSRVVLGSFNIRDWENPHITLSVHKKRVIEKYAQEILK